MTGTRKLRADAARNSAQLLRAAREVLTEQGAEAPLSEIAARAGVGIATLYRRYPDRATLLRAVLEQGFDEDLAPVIDAALAGDEPFRGLVAVLETTLRLAERQHNVLAAANDVGVLSAGTSDRFFGPVALLVRRAQEVGALRDDLTPEDVLRLVVMLLSVIITTPAGTEGWRRHLQLALEGLGPREATTLPPAAPLADRFRPAAAT